MATNTVIKELFEFIRLSHPNIDDDVNEEFWEDKFRRHIIDAYEKGDKYKFEIPGEDYYTQTYINETEK